MDTIGLKTFKLPNNWIFQLYWPRLILKKTEFTFHIDLLKFRVAKDWDRKYAFGFCFLGFGAGIAQKYKLPT